MNMDQNVAPEWSGLDKAKADAAAALAIAIFSVLLHVSFR